MAKPGSKKAGARPWKFTVGLKPHTVSAFERKDKSNAVWLRWNRAGTGLYDKMSLGLRLRDDLGRFDDEKVAAAQEMARKAYNRLLKGEDPRTPESSVATDERRALTVVEGLKLALRIPDGMYAVENEHTRDMRRYEQHILRFLPPDVTTWDDISSVTYEQLWRSMATWRTKENVRNRAGKIAGKRATELAIILLAQAGRWLKRAKKLPTAPDEQGERWLERFALDWARITKQPVVAADPPRHSAEELGRLFQAIDRSEGDPRIRLSLTTAGEARIGQAIRCDRSALDLSPVGAHGLGRFTIPDTGKKKGVMIDLTPSQRAAWDHELREGYLADLEAAYQGGRRETYPLFPAGRLKRGRAALSVIEHLGKRAALDMFHELEGKAGVEIVHGRGWYGVRRIATDLAEDVEQDGRALNAITGHTSDATRRKVYQAKNRDVVLAKASNARHAARALAIQAAELATESGRVATAPSAPSGWARQREAKRLRRLAAHPVPTGRKTGGKRAQLAASERDGKDREDPRAAEAMGDRLGAPAPSRPTAEVSLDERGQDTTTRETARVPQRRPTPEPTPTAKTRGNGS